MSKQEDKPVNLKGPKRKSRNLKENLLNYEETYLNFCWEESKQELGIADGKWNIAVEAVDKQAAVLRHKVAFRFFGGIQQVDLTYLQLKDFTNQFANVLLTLGLQPNERVAIFLPPQPEFYIAFLGTVKAGAIVVPLSTSFMPDAITEILRDCDASVLVTSEQLVHRVQRHLLPSLSQVIIVGGTEDAETPRTYEQNEYQDEKSIDYALAMKKTSSDFTARECGQDTPMMLLYTSGSTGKPKGVIHVHGGLPHYYQTGKWVLDLHTQDIYWCTPEPGWIPGISYGIWAPLLNGVTSIIYTKEFNPEKWYEVLAKNRISVWYTTPTALRRLMNFGPVSPSKRYELKNLRHILTVGEPLNPIVIRWSSEAFGLKVYDTWWMTETGGHLISNFRCLPIKPGSMGKPVPGIEAAIIDEQGNELPPLEVGQLAIKVNWPAMMRGLWKDEEKYQEYFRLPPWYLSGDLAYCDSEGYFWFQGRVDDVIKKAGERIGPFEIENKLGEHPAVMEAGVIGKPDPLWGEIIKAFIVLRSGFEWSEELKVELQQFIENRLGSHLVPREIEPCQLLPRTRTGKIMRRVLKAHELGLPSGDLSTLVE